MKSIKLPADLRITSAEGLRDRLATALDGAGALRVHGGAVTRVDLAGVQLLVAAAAEAKRRGRDMQLAGASAPLAEAVQLLGLDTALPLKTHRAATRRAPKD